MKSKLDMQVLYVIKDNVAERFSPIQSAPTVGVAKRQFKMLLEKTPNLEEGDFSLLIFQHVDSVQEYDLFEVNAYLEFKENEKID